MAQSDYDDLTADVQSTPVASAEDVFVFSASFAQQRLWFLDQLDPGNTVYNLPSALRLLGSLDVAAVQKSLSEIVRRHEALRTTFESVDGRPVQIISPAEEINLPVLDLSALEVESRESRVRQEATDEGRRSFDLARGPLLRVKLLKLGDEAHVLLVTTHHMVADGWSQRVLRHELATLYEAYREGRPSPLPELPIQYADYACWQHELLSGRVLEDQLAYWKQQLADTPAVLELPTDFPRPAVQSHRGAHLPLSIDPHLTAQLKELGRREGVTLFMLMLAAYEVLLYRYTGQTEVVVGMPIANRTQAETEALIGFFVNTLALRVSLAGEPSWRELLQSVREATLGALAHQGLPFEKLVEELRPAREMSHHPLFQVTFTFQNAPKKEVVELKGLTLSTVKTEADTAIADLSLVLTETTDSLEGGINYSTDLFVETTVKKMAAHYEQLLWAMVTHPGQRITVSQMLSEAERHQVLDEWNQTSSPLPDDLSPHQLFEQQVQRSPEALALSCAGTRFTYRQLNDRANQLAHLLRQRGVRPESTVALLLPRSSDLVIAALAVLKAGGAYLPLDPSDPVSRLSFIIDHGTACLLITLEHLTASLPAAPGPLTISLDEDGPLIDEQSTTNLLSAVLPDNLAYVIYTSGSTGEPQGIEISHRSLLNLICWHQRVFNVTAADRATQLASVGFDASVWEVWPYLTAGASLHIVPEEVRLEAERLRDWMVEHEITISFVPTPLAEQLLQLEWMYAASFRVLLTGGDQLHEWGRGDASFVLVNNYGPTEATVVATSGEVKEEGSGGAEKWPTIGRSIANTRVYVVDKELELVPVGVVGEICIGGEGLARGYVGGAERTAARFMPDPYRAGGVRLYRTGDLGRYRAEGEIEYVGRMDHQVKVRGYRIELGEVEAALREQHGVSEAVVIAREEEQGNRRLVAYVVAEGEGTPGTTEMQGELRKRLPEYMVPSVFILLTEMPLTPRGKVDRRALPAPDRLRARSEVEFVAPRTAAEEVVAEIWMEILGLDRVGMYDNFFDLGGHSLLATQVLSQIQSIFRVDVPIQDLFQIPTVENLVEAISKVWGQREIVEEIARTYKHVGTLSPDEVQQSLSEQVQGTS
jgi:amino acid adenylation domain-containing protein